MTGQTNKIKLSACASEGVSRLKPAGGSTIALAPSSHSCRSDDLDLQKGTSGRSPDFLFRFLSKNGAKTRGLEHFSCVHFIEGDGDRLMAGSVGHLSWTGLDHCWASRWDCPLTPPIKTGGGIRIHCQSPPTLWIYMIVDTMDILVRAGSGSSRIKL